MIALTETRMTPDGPACQRHKFRGSVAHFGRRPPAGKDSVVVVGSGVADHHAKLFFAQRRFWLLNLCGLPCGVLKASGRTVFLTVSDPAVEVDVGESFQIGDVTFLVDAATPPRGIGAVSIPKADAVWVEQLRAEAEVFSADRIRPPSDSTVCQISLEFSRQLWEYTDANEIWRHTADALGETFEKRWQEEPPSSLLVFASRLPCIDDQPPVVSVVLPKTSLPPGEYMDFLSQANIPHQLLAAINAAALSESRPIQTCWRSNESSEPVQVLAGPVTNEDYADGVIALIARWNGRGHVQPDLDDFYLFHQFLATQSLSLTFLRQRQEAMRFERLHDIGAAAMEAAHDECHLIERAEGCLGDLLDVSAKSHSSLQIDVSRIEQTSKRIRAIIRRVRAVGRTMLHFVKEQSGQTAEKVGRIEFSNCTPAIREWFDEAQWTIFDAAIEVVSEFEVGDVFLWGDRDGILAALLNLQVNAVRAIQTSQKADAKIVLRAEVRHFEPTPDESERYVVLSVKDTGLGIPADLRDRIFRDRIEDSRSGHALGTRIVRRVMDKHQGLIRFSTEAGRGTLVELWFPQLLEAESWKQQWPLFERIRNRFGSVARLVDEPGGKDAADVEYSSVQVKS